MQAPPLPRRFLHHGSASRGRRIALCRVIRAAFVPHDRVWSVTAARRTLAGGLLGLALVAGDVFSPASLHLLQPLDAACHAWVMSHVPAEARATLADLVLSDAPILAAMAGWAYSAWVAHAAVKQEQQGEGQQGNSVVLWQALSLATAIYGLAGPYSQDDAPVVHLLKSSFERARPSPMHFTYSFPSGHTTEAVVMSGVLLFLLLPVLQAELQWRRRERHERQNTTAAALTRQETATADLIRRETATADLTLQDTEAAAALTRAASVLWAQRPSALAFTLSMPAGQHRPAVPPSPSAATAASAGPQTEGATPAAPAAWLNPLLRHRGAVWVGCGLVTASGRILADAHWLSDTLAGACLGAALVSATVLTWEALAGAGCHDQES